MGYASLLFCADEKTTRLLTQVLKDLEFSVESASEAFVAVKSLMAQHFDLLVVDCDNEQNAALIYKSAKNSTANANSLAVAVVDGHGGIAKAFRIGANLVLTKPINVEQSKGTLRVARGLLRKAEATRAATPAPASAPAPTESLTSTLQPEVQESAPSLASSVTASAAAAAPAPAKALLPAPTLEVEQEPTPKLGPAEAGVIEAIPDPILRPSKKEKQAVESSSQTSSAAAPAASKAHAPEVAPPAAAIAEPKGKDKDKDKRKDKHKQEKQEESKAAASAKAEEKTEKPAASGKNSLETAAAAAAPRFSSVGVTQEEETFDPATSRKNFIIAAIIVLIAAVGGYFGWARFHPNIKLPFLQEQLAPPASEIKIPSAPKPSPEALAIQSGIGQDAAIPAAGQASTPAQADGTNSASKDAAPPANSAKPVASDQTAAASQTANTQPARHPLKLSESVAEGLLISKVPPAYPEQAKKLKLEGPVQLEARIGIDGSISDVKAISGNDLLAHAATEAVRKWKYRPYVVNGHAVDIATRITVDFKLP